MMAGCVGHRARKLRKNPGNRTRPGANAASRKAARRNARRRPRGWWPRTAGASSSLRRSSRFSEEKDRFLHAVEQEVVKLALAVAARILRREAQMDPLLLTGAVRVALGQLAASSEVRLQVPAKDAGLWSETMALLPHLAMRPIVVPVEGMRLGDCVIESKAGTVDLGVPSQLGEIERGFFDRANSAATPVADMDARTNDSTPHTANEPVQR